MKIRVTIQEARISKSNVAEAYGMSRQTLNSRINKGLMPSPSGHNNKYTRRDVEGLFQVLGKPEIPPRMRPKGRDKKYFNEIMRCILLVESDGVFIVDEDADHKTAGARYAAAIKEYGVLDTQGLCNHVHLAECGVTNPVFQMVVAEQIMEYWAKLASSLQHKKKTLIVLRGTGIIDTEVCIFLVTRKDELLFEEYYGRRGGFYEVQVRKDEIEMGHVIRHW